MTTEKDNQKKDYSKIEAVDNMKVEDSDDITEVTKKEKPKQVLAEPPKKRKKGLMERLVVGFLGPDGLPGIGAYLNEEIIVPSIKNIIVEAVTSGINMAVFGDRSKVSPRSQNSAYDPNRTVYRPQQTQYHTRTSRFTTAQPAPTKRPPEVIQEVRYLVDEYPIESHHVANDVLVTLQEYADKYDYVSVADYYDILGVNSVHTDHNYGWSFDNIVKATVVPLRGGNYIINFPPIENL